MALLCWPEINQTEQKSDQQLAKKHLRSMKASNNKTYRPYKFEFLELIVFSISLPLR